MHMINGFKKRIKPYLEVVRSSFLLGRNVWYDARRFAVHSAMMFSEREKVRLEALLTMDYHRIEKGLALRAPRVGFGKDVVRRLIGNIGVHLDRFGPARYIEIALNTLDCYVEYHRARAISNDELAREIRNLRERNGPVSNRTIGGIKTVKRGNIRAAAMVVTDEFFSTRHSVRQFIPGDLPLASVEEAIRLAMTTPSVCNRQAWRVHTLTTADAKQRALRLQNGNKGFGDQATYLLVVTVDLRLFVSPGERNQGWVDGGMFAMSLVYALHAQGLGTCCLNWSVLRDGDEALHHEIGIPSNESVIMLIAVGNMPEEFVVAQSPRRTLGEVHIVHGEHSDLGWQTV